MSLSDHNDYDDALKEPLGRLFVQLPKCIVPAHEPAVLDSPWYRYLILPEQERRGNKKEILSTFEPFSQLPPQLDPHSDTPKSKPPELFLGIPLDEDFIVNYAAKYDLLVYIDQRTLDFVGWKPRHEVTPDLLISLDATADYVFKDIKACLWQHVRFETSYGNPDPRNSCMPLWAFCSNFDPLDERPTAEHIAELRKELGLSDIMWYLSTSA